ncbi:hypothetical protein LPJ75_007352, partial [Coemansia sp. RSA 2598]
MKSTARFDEFSTVDWMEDSARERKRQQMRRHGIGPSASTVLPLPVYALYDSMVSWIVLLLVGILIGINTAFISIVT